MSCPSFEKNVFDFFLSLLFCCTELRWSEHILIRHRMIRSSYVMMASRQSQSSDRLIRCPGLSIGNQWFVCHCHPPPPPFPSQQESIHLLPPSLLPRTIVKSELWSQTTFYTLYIQQKSSHECAYSKSVRERERNKKIELGCRTPSLHSFSPRVSLHQPDWFLPLSFHPISVGYTYLLTYTYDLLRRQWSINW